MCGRVLEGFLKKIGEMEMGVIDRCLLSATAESGERLL